MAELDTTTIRHALSTAREHGFRVVRLSLDGEEFRATLDPIAPASELPMLALVEDDDYEVVSEEQVAVDVKAPQVGYFELGKKPVSAGQMVEKGTVVGEIRALGIKNEVLAPDSGLLDEILVAVGDAVEFGQVLMRLRK